MVSFLGACSALGFAVMLFGAAHIASDVQIIIALIGAATCAICAGLAAILHKLNQMAPPPDPT